MIDQLEALRAVAEAGTTARAAVRLRLTQSAVSKRIAALEALAGAPLLERDGRGSRLTPAAERLLRDARPLLAALADAVAAAGSTEARATLRVAASESLLASWLPGVLVRVRAALPALALELHAHRGPALVARVASGEADVAIAVDAVAEAGVVSLPLGDEPMVIVPAGGRRLRPDTAIDCWTIEERSLTWAALQPRLRSSRRPWGHEIRVTGRLESFTALARCAQAGLAHALVPRGVALAAGVPAAALLPLPGLERPLALVTRRSAQQRRVVALFTEALRRQWPRSIPQ